MAINMTTNPAFTGRHTAASADYPFGSSQDESSSGAGDGTPYLKVRSDDVFGLQQALLRASGQTPSGSADTAVASQYFQAIVELIMGRAVLAADNSSTANAIVLQAAPNQQPPRVLFDGLTVAFKVPITNTGATTLNAFALGAKSIAGSAAGSLVAGEYVAMRYDQTADEYVRADSGAAVDVAIGAGQEWADLTASRTFDTIYTNDTRKPIGVSMIVISSSQTQTRQIQVRSDSGSPWIVVSTAPDAASAQAGRPFFIVPAGHQYRINGNATISRWSELR